MKTRIVPLWARLKLIGFRIRNALPLRKKPLSKKNIQFNMLFGMSIVALQTKKKLPLFERVRNDINAGKIRWIGEEKRTAAIAFVAARMAGIELTEANSGLAFEKLSGADKMGLESLIRTYP